MNEAYEFQMVVAASYSNDAERYQFLRNGELDDVFFNEMDAQVFGFGIVSEFKPKFAVLDGFDQSCNCHRHDHPLH